MPDDRSYQGRPHERPAFGGGGQQRPFRPNPRLETPPPPIAHTLKLRDGDREIEVSGSAVFVRQVLDDLPALLAKLHGGGPSRPARIDLPAARPVEAGAPAEEPSRPVTRDGNASGNGRTSSSSSIDDRVLAVLEGSARPLAVAAIRKRLGGSVTPQQVRRILERNAPRVSVTDERPATYRLR